MAYGGIFQIFVKSAVLLYPVGFVYNKNILIGTFCTLFHRNVSAAKGVIRQQMENLYENDFFRKGQ